VEERFKAKLDKILHGDDLKHTILAVSGGIDSVVMAHLFKAVGYPFSIAHCNFQLRGSASDEDEVFVKELAEKLDVAIDIRRFDTVAFADRKGISIQMAARELRYEWFNLLAEEKRGRIALAHHANDVVETILFNLAKGTGIAGMHGMAEEDDVVIRPMLWVKKIEIEDYAVVNKIEWREDQSNQSEKYMRNIIRRKVIPELERINTSFVEAGLRTAFRVKESEDFIRYAINKLDLVEEKEGNIFISIQGLHQLQGKFAVIYELLKPYGFNYDQVKSIEQSLPHTGAMFFSQEWSLNIDRDYLIISSNKEKKIEVRVERETKIIEVPLGVIAIEVHEAGGYELQKRNDIAALNYEKLSFPLQLRNWQQGDSFVPLGMEGRKKVSDFLIDEKVPVALKPNILVLLSGDEIVWIVGYRINEHYKFSSQVKHIYQIKLSKNGGL
jgi:tRNA(Ile)-lysidine synthase